MKEVTKDYAKNVLEILHHDEVKIGEFETELNMTRGTLSKFARGLRVGMSIDLAFEIADKMEIDFIEILTTDWTKTFEEEDRIARIEMLEMEQRAIADELKKLRN